MTLKEIVASDRVVLTPTDVAGVLECSAYAINQQAKEDPDKLGFPVIMIGHRVKIPRMAFLDFVTKARIVEEAVG